MAIGRDGDRIVSIGSPTEEASGFSPRGLCCGFIRVTQSLKVGEKVMLSDGKRKLEVEIRSDVRPDRTARRPLSEML